MRLKPALKYQLSSIKWSVIIYYIVIYTLVILAAVSQAFWPSEGHISYGGLDGASIIFLFVVGLNAFRSNFHMFVVNGISRKTMFTSFIISAIILCAGMALIDSINALVISQFVTYRSVSVQMYDFGLSMFSEGFLWMLFSYMASIMFGYFITTAYYRMNKPVKLLVSIGVPLLLFIILPLVDATLFNGQIFNAFRLIALFCSGQSSGSPYIAMASNLVSAAITASFAYLLARRATVKLTAG